MPPSPFPDLPISGVAFPDSAIAAAAFAYTREHTAEGVYNHCVRSAYWALILARKLAPLAAASPDLETVVLACVLHDMGWALDKALLSDHKRFEVDGADIARRFVLAYRARGGDGAAEWDDARVQTVWDAIALHTTTSIAPFGSAEVAAAHLGIMADFTGPRFPADPWGDPAKQRAPAGEEEEEGAVITVDEFREVVGAFPYAGFGAEASKAILCGLCRDKPGSTFDNFVGAFGRAYGLDGEGRGREEYTAMWARATDPANVVGNFDYLQGLLGENKEG